jgi:hypothetical protein
MKTSKINLSLNKRQEENARSKKQLLALRWLAVGMLFITGTAAIILFILIASSPLPNLRKQENGLLFQMTQLHEKMGKHLLVSDQLRDISTIITTREDITKTIRLIREQMPTTVNLDTFSKDEEGITVFVSSRNLDDIDGFIKSISRITEEDKAFAKIALSNLSMDNLENKYILSLEITPI